MEGDGEPDGKNDLLCGITPKHIRILCENSWEGGMQYTPKQVGDMTLDQIFMLLADRKVLRSSRMRHTESVSSLEVKMNDDGFVDARDKDGNPIRLRKSGKSLARQLMEKVEAEKDMSPRKRRAQRRKERSEKRLVIQQNDK